jgi:hypothetical protein
MLPEAPRSPPGCDPHASRSIAIATRLPPNRFPERRDPDGRLPLNAIAESFRETVAPREPADSADTGESAAARPADKQQ